MTTRELKLLFGENLKKYREKKGWSQTKLAVETGVDARSIARYENGERHPYITVMVLLADILGVEAWNFYCP